MWDLIAILLVRTAGILYNILIPWVVNYCGIYIIIIFITMSPSLAFALLILSDAIFYLKYGFWWSPRLYVTRVTLCLGIFTLCVSVIWGRFTLFFFRPIIFYFSYFTYHFYVRKFELFWCYSGFLCNDHRKCSDVIGEIMVDFFSVNFRILSNLVKIMFRIPGLPQLVFIISSLTFSLLSRIASRKVWFTPEWGMV